MTVLEVALNPCKGNILGFDVLASKQWCLPDGRVWSFGGRGIGTVHVKTLQVALLLPQSKVTCVLQCSLPIAAKQGILEVINDLEKGGIISRTHSPYNSQFGRSVSQMGSGG